MIEGMLAYYGINTPGAIPGIFNSVQSYYWWMAGAAWNVSPTGLGGELIVGDDAVLVANW